MIPGTEKSPIGFVTLHGHVSSPVPERKSCTSRRVSKVALIILSDGHVRSPIIPPGEV